MKHRLFLALTDDLTDLADHTNIGLDKFQLLTPSTSSAQTQLQPTSSVNYTANYAPATTSYPTMHSSSEYLYSKILF